MRLVKGESRTTQQVMILKRHSVKEEDKIKRKSMGSGFLFETVRYRNMSVSLLMKPLQWEISSVKWTFEFLPLYHPPPCLFFHPILVLFPSPFVDGNLICLFEIEFHKICFTSWRLKCGRHTQTPGKLNQPQRSLSRFDFMWNHYQIKTFTTKL